MLRRTIMYILLLCLIVPLLPVTIFAEEEILASGYSESKLISWKLKADGTLIFSGKGEYHAEQETSYAWKAYADRIYRIIIEDGVTNVPSAAFTNLSNLESVSLGDTVQIIEKSAFSGSKNLRSVFLPDNLVIIEKYAFAGTGLYSVMIPFRVTKIQEGAFYECKDLSHVLFAPDIQLNTIGKKAFAYSGIKTITIPEKTKIIDTYAFTECRSLENVILRDGIGEICAHAFDGCTNLKNVRIGKVKSIGTYVFWNCKNIESLYINTSAEFYSYTKLENLKELIIGESTTKVNVMFDDLKFLSTVILGEKVKSIIEHAFRDCTSLTSIVLPKSLEVIGRSAFRKTGLTRIVFPESLKEIGSEAFWEAPLEEIVFLGDCPEIDISAFREISATAYYPENNTSWTDEKMQNYSGNLTWVPYSCNNGHIEERIPGYEATCAQTGLTEGTRCAMCGEILEEQQEIAAQDHTIRVLVGEKATCTLSGGTDVEYCSLCGTITKRRDHLHAGHSFGSWTTTKQPTVEAPGLEEHICERCGTREERVLEQLTNQNPQPTDPTITPTEPIDPPTDPATEPSDSETESTQTPTNAPTEPTQAPADPTQPDITVKEEPKTFPWAIVVIAVAAIGAAAGGVIIGKKRK